MVECCKNCKYFENAKCLIHDEIFENNSVDTLDYVIGDGIIAEKLREPLEKLNLSDYDKESLIDDIETIVKNTMIDEYDIGFNIKNYINFKCNKYE